MQHNLWRYIYLNSYGLLFILGSAVSLLIPLWSISKWWIILQICVAIFCFSFGTHLLSMWNDKIRQYNTLLARNKKEFRPDSFAIYMDYPCGRKIVRAVLRDLKKSSEYKNLLMYKPSLVNEIQDCLNSIL